MTFTTLAQSYLVKAGVRLKVLELLLSEGAYSDVVREAQELVELATKAMLRAIGVEPPHWHDVGKILLEHSGSFSEPVRAQLRRIAEISAALRKEREFSFYGDEDFIPTEQYDRASAEKAVSDARFVLSVAEQVVPRGP